MEKEPCKFWSVEGKEKYQVCGASGRQCFCEGNLWYCENRKEMRLMYDNEQKS